MQNKKKYKPHYFSFKCPLKSKLQKLFLFAIKKIITCKRANEDDSVILLKNIFFSLVCAVFFNNKKKLRCMHNANY